MRQSAGTGECPLPQRICKRSAEVLLRLPHSKKAENYLLQSLSSVITGTVQDSENRIARMDFKLAVELSKLAHVIAYTHEVDEDALHQLHLKCLEEVRRINGAVDFESAYKYQKRET